MDWRECVSKGFLKEIKTDENLINSLVKTSDNKIETNNRLELDETSASTKVSIVYESLREILEAFAIKKGFKIYSHECFVSFLDEICNNKSFSREFDGFRRIRNQINYYGRIVPVNEAEIIIKEISLLRNKILNQYFK